MDKMKQIKVLILLLKEVIIPILSDSRKPKLILYTKISKEWFELFKHNLKHYGIYTAVAINKEMRLMVTKYISGDPIKLCEKYRIGITSKGLPKKPLSLRSLDFSDDEDLKFILTLYNIPRSLLPPKTRIDLGSVENPWMGNIDDISTKEIRSSLKKLIGWNYERMLETTFKKYLTSSKTAPSGLNALMGSLLEARIIKDYYPDLVNNIRVLAGDVLADKLIAVASYRNSFNVLTEKESSIRRLVAIPDKELKSRNIAILDYWSQQSLLQLHTSLMTVLSNIKTDMTYHQAAIPLNNLKECGKVYSFDLKSATDRFPLSFQERVLSLIIGKRRTDAWSKLLTQYEFYVSKGRYTKYMCGQPMGAYSSWAVFSLCHHLVANIAIQRARGISPTIPDDCYRLLGDDIIIYNDPVANEYLKIMKQLDVEISKHKTHLSDTAFELAKRWFKRNKNGDYVEITGFPLAGVYSVCKVPHLVANYFKNVINHGWGKYRDILEQPDTVRHFIKIIGYRFDKQYLDDFVFTLFGVSHINDVDNFIRRFSSLNPFCESYPHRFTEYVRDVYMVCKIKQLENDAELVQNYYLDNQISNLVDEIRSWYNTVGKDLSILPPDSIEFTFPHIAAWSLKYTEYMKVHQLYYSHLNGIEIYPENVEYMYNVFRERNYVSLLGKPEAVKINVLPKSQQVLKTTVKITRSMIKAIKIGDLLEVLYPPIKDPETLGWA